VRSKRIAYSISRVLNYLRSWRTDDKIVIIESDDWGSIRTSTPEAYARLLKHGYNLHASKYSLDTLETNDDLMELFGILAKQLDSKGNPACFTANMIMANPDFDRIQATGFEEYYFESVQNTLSRDLTRNQVQRLWSVGLKSGLFYCQLHARDHLRYWEWLRDLKLNKPEAIETFQYRMCGVPLACSKSYTSYYLPVYVDEEIFAREKIDQRKLIEDGFNLFEKEFNMKSLSTVAPGIGWTDSTEKVWRNRGVKYLQGGYLQEHHTINHVKYFPHYLGEKSPNNEMFYLVRNCYFEPSDSKDNDYWKSTLRQIEIAFRRKTPAIISSHRVNYIGSISESNREKSLKQLDLLLGAIVRQWPNVIFENTVQLGKRIFDSYN